MATTLGAMAIGSIVKINVGGVPREFIVVQHGKPSPIYDDSFNGGTWLLIKDGGHAHGVPKTTIMQIVGFIDI